MCVFQSEGTYCVKCDLDLGLVILELNITKCFVVVPQRVKQCCCIVYVYFHYPQASIIQQTLLLDLIKAHRLLPVHNNHHLLFPYATEAIYAKVM